jgi:outer membrane protein assembly factor BamE (lipoprotein component of BamABCDE complex)
MKTNKLPWLVAALLTALSLAGCATPESRIRRNPEIFARLSAPQQDLVRKGQIAIGLDREAVRLALGEPDQVTVRTDERGTSEIWRYVEYDMYDPWFYGYAWGYPSPGYRWGGWGYPHPFFSASYYHARTHELMRVTFRADKVVAFTQHRN